MEGDAANSNTPTLTNSQTSYPVILGAIFRSTNANGTLCCSYTCIAQFNNTKFTSFGGMPANFGQSSHNAPKTGLDAGPLRIPELARARPSLRCAPFKYSWCMGEIRCVTIYRFFGAEEMDFGPQRSPTS
jgi:hypothetical protein